MKVVYIELAENRGTRYALQRGLEVCSHSLIFKMDSDDIMVPLRIAKQMSYMDEHPDVMICGSQMIFFREDEYGRKICLSEPTKHRGLYTSEDEIPRGWFMNHPTICFRKSAVFAVGGYEAHSYGQNSSMMEDYELELRMLMTYGMVVNLEEVLVYYRIHEGQLTAHWQDDCNEMVQWRREIWKRVFLGCV